MSIPCRINPLGREREPALPAGYTRLEYLENPYGFDVVDTIAFFKLDSYTYDVLNGDTLELETQHQVPSIPASWTAGGGEGFWEQRRASALFLYNQARSIFGLPNSVDRTDVVNNMAFTADGRGAFGDTALVDGYDYSIFNQGQALDTDWHIYRGHLALGDFRYSRDGVTSTSIYSPLCQGFAILTVFGVNGDNGSVRPMVGRKKYFKFWMNGELKHHLVPCLDETSTPCMYDLVTKETHYNAGNGLDFIPSPT